jgi:hypothetical protein
VFIVWGRKLVYRNVGFIADLCPICRCTTAFKLVRVGSAGHVYYISAGEGQLVGFERTCLGCGTSLQANPASYVAVSKRALPLAELVNHTFPNLEEALRERLAIEDRVKQDPLSLSSEERRALIRTPFILLSPKVEKRFASTHIDKEVGFSLIAAIGLLAIGPALMHKAFPDSADLFVLIFMCLGVLLVGWQAIMSGRRFMRRHVVPVLAKSLRPLHPSEEELSGVLAELKALRHKIGKKVDLAELLVKLAPDTASLQHPA